MKQAIIGLTLVAVGMCTITSTTRRSAADEYYNKGSNIIGGETTGMGGSLTGVGKKLGGEKHHKIGGKLARSVNPLGSTEEDELAYNIKID